MSETAKLEEIYSAIEEAARLRGVACSRDKIWTTLTAYKDALEKAAALVVFSMAGGESHSGELDYSFSVPSGGVDPYTTALSNGLTPKTDHPVGALLSDVQERCPIDVYGVDSGVVGGFKKTYAFFSLKALQGLPKLADIPSMPSGLGENVDSFARYGLEDKVSIVGVDYQDRTMNVYFSGLPAECLEPKAIASMLQDIGLPEPSEQMMTFIQKSFAIYATIGWDSPKVERICFAVITTDSNALPAQLEPEIGHFAKNSPYAYDGDRTLVYGSTLSSSGEYYKLGAYYQRPPETRRLLAAFNTVGGPN